MSAKRPQKETAKRPPKKRGGAATTTTASGSQKRGHALAGSKLAGTPAGNPYLVVDELLFPFVEAHERVLLLEPVKACGPVEEVAIEADRACLQSGSLCG